MPCTLFFAGDGELRSVVEERVRSRSLPGVRFAGFLNQTELPRAYMSADLMVLPSAYGETWGMVVNEAMNFGLPVIVSDRVGCVGDLVRDGVNGFVFESGNLEALVQALRTLVSSAGLRHSYGLKSLEIISGYTLEKSTMQITNAFLSVLGHEARAYAESSTSA
jgi:glycosyltransferase involved in cell wall biosynthesis